MQYEPQNQTNEQEASSFDLTTMSKPELNGHLWRQQGTLLYCQSCTLKHATYITDNNGNPAVDYQLYGIDKDGSPMFRKIKP